MIKMLFYQANPCDSLRTYFNRHFNIIEANSDNVLSHIAKDNYDIALLDAYLGQESDDPYYLVRCVRDLSSKTLIVMVTRDNSCTNMIKALSLGVDLYFTKPYYIDEMCAQINSLAKRISVRAVNDIYKIGEYTFNVKTGELVCGEFYKKLSHKSKELLRVLYENRNTVVSRAELLKNVWHTDDFFAGRSMDVYLCHLRTDLSIDPDIFLECLYSTGYILHCPQ